MSSTPYVIDQHQARELLARIDVPQILRKLFRDLAAGTPCNLRSNWWSFLTVQVTSSTIWACWLKTAFTA
jgi:hypothetical protein